MPARAAGLTGTQHDLERIDGQVDIPGGAASRCSRPAAIRWSVRRLLAPFARKGAGREQWGHRNPRVAADDVTRERTARRSMVVRLRVRIARLEAEQASESRIGEVRQEFRALNRPARNAD